MDKKESYPSLWDPAPIPPNWRLTSEGLARGLRKTPSWPLCVLPPGGLAIDEWPHSLLIEYRRVLKEFLSTDERGPLHDDRKLIARAVRRLDEIERALKTRGEGRSV